jgi:hypothetical protein
VTPVALNATGGCTGQDASANAANVQDRLANNLGTAAAWSTSQPYSQLSGPDPLVVPLEPVHPDHRSVQRARDRDVHLRRGAILQLLHQRRGQADAATAKQGRGNSGLPSPLFVVTILDVCSELVPYAESAGQPDRSPAAAAEAPVDVRAEAVGFAVAVVDVAGAQVERGVDDDGDDGSTPRRRLSPARAHDHRHGDACDGQDSDDGQRDDDDDSVQRAGGGAQVGCDEHAAADSRPSLRMALPGAPDRLPRLRSSSPPSDTTLSYIYA